MSAPSRLMPQDVETEKSVLGGILLSPGEIDNVAAVLKGDDFYSGKHKHIFAAMLSLSARSEPIDIRTLVDELRTAGTLQHVGVDYIGELDLAGLAAVSVVSHAKIVKRKADARKLIEAAREIERLAMSDEEDIAKVYDTASQKILDLSTGTTRKGFESAGTVARRVYKDLEARFERRDEDGIVGVRTGFRDFDRMTAGFRPGQLIIVAGRPAMGKTALAMSAACNAAIGKANDPNHPPRTVGVFSLEMSSDSLMERLMSSEGRVDGTRIRSGRMTNHDWPKLARGTDRIVKSGLQFCDSTDLTVPFVAAECRRIKAKRGDLGLVVVDYLQLMRGTNSRESREQEIASISRGLKKLAIELACPFVVLSQLNRKLEDRADKRPVMSDLRESGAIEQDADLIVFCYRDEVYNEESKDKGTAELIIGKQRSGPLGTARVAFIGEYTRFEDLDRDHDDERGGRWS